ncbi:MAG: S-adenosylmethionine:tRNA ribosyltransferase-isomerase [Bacteroidales bacterium]|nr:S-adenosylmethionine:tRNA ribosyltransferase-isomerase [Bacteroidales bacterium]
MKLANIKISDYHYELPASRIAAYPLPDRQRSKLLVCNNDVIEDAVFENVDRYLEPGSLMLLNDTRVVQARLEFFKPSGARIEIFCLHPMNDGRDPQLALARTGSVSWLALVGNAKKWKEGPLEIVHPEADFRLEARKGAPVEDACEVVFSWTPSRLSFGEVLEKAGKTPLPPYITRAAEEGDKTSYQCVFARNDGSVAAPTAGLHFTPDMIRKLRSYGVHTEYLTLHVGAGTFKPVSAAQITGHSMHAEPFVIERRLLDRLIRHLEPSENDSTGAKSLMCVGTTSMRTLESLYWIGALIGKGEAMNISHAELAQWVPYGWQGEKPPPLEALKSLRTRMEENDLEQLKGSTSLIIVPGYPFQLTDILLTNFHLPKSTLLLLVAAFAGPEWKRIYNHALAGAYRFLSYGDACLLFRKEMAS